MNSSSNDDALCYFRAKDGFKRGEYASCIHDFLRLSLRGDARASLYAATIFDRGGGGIAPDCARACELYKLSLAQSYLPGAAFGLAMMLYRKHGGTQDYYESAKYFGMLQNNAFSQLMLGLMSLKGLGCERSEDDALHHFDKAWALGHPLGLKNAAIIRFHRGRHATSMFNFIYAFFLIIWNYGIKRLPLVMSPRDNKELSC